MICNTNLCIAVKNELGQYETKNLTIFEINNIHEKYKNIELIENKNKEVKFKIKCPICNKYHYYNYSILSLMKNEMVIGGCELLGIPVFFIGNNEKVNERVNKYREINKKIYAMI